MIGQRGVPATFGGVERHVEELGAELVDRGHDVTTFCRTNYVPGRPGHCRGMRLRHLPTVGTKHLDAICHSGLCTAAIVGKGFDIVHYHGLGPGLASPVPRWLSRAKVVWTVHGRDDQRAKWGLAARQVLGTASWMSARVPDAIIAVSEDLTAFYASRYGRVADYIPNGVVPPTRRLPGATLQRLGLHPGRYLLFVGRLVPEKAPDVLIRAFRRLEGDFRLVIVGGSSFTSSYLTVLEELAASDPRVILVGYQYGEALEELYSNAGVFVLPSSLEGLPLTLLEAGAFGIPIVASDIPPHLEVLGPSDRAGRRTFPPGRETDLVAALYRSLQDPIAERAAADSFRDEVLARYRWDRIADRTEEVYRRILAMPSGRSMGPELVAESTQP